MPHDDVGAARGGAQVVDAGGEQPVERGGEPRLQRGGAGDGVLAEERRGGAVGAAVHGARELEVSAAVEPESRARAGSSVGCSVGVGGVRVGRLQAGGDGVDGARP